MMIGNEKSGLAYNWLVSWSRELFSQSMGRALKKKMRRRLLLIFFFLLAVICTSDAPSPS
jgi:hypothetical protein